MARYTSLKRELNDAEEINLENKAQEKLQNRVRHLYNNTTEKKIFPMELSDKCPHCGKPQTWSISVMETSKKEWPIFIAVIGGIISLITLIATESENKLKSTLVAVGITVVVAALSYAYSIFKIADKKRKTAMVLTPQLPSINWSVMDDLLKEANSK